MDKSVAFTSVDLKLSRSALRQQCQLQDPVSINLDQVLQATRMVARIQLPVPPTTELAQALPMIEIEIAGLDLILDHIEKPAFCFAAATAFMAFSPRKQPASKARWYSAHARF
ncbi:hypothetical protein ACIPSK_19245 [Rhizobium sp. LARHSG275]|uniref:hypothetical protein n=1 Tax=Rhizobium TaxID=379 RepID=UPI0013897469|nr:hypothetical protein [Rhizobium laguerreae]NDK54162.1 hypothetical protein [Rhizobium laguerreae]